MAPQSAVQSQYTDEELELIRRELESDGVEFSKLAPEALERQVVQNPDGSISTERTVTIQDPRIHKGLWVNIPTMFGGKEVSQERAIDIIAENKGVDPETGREVPFFTSLDEAISEAKARSDSLGAAHRKREQQ
jgi:hypothetical protein|tara:strand:- start:135 stop:536 length:402 start_codon:yes stop_codon:yes gene_type:complete